MIIACASIFGFFLGMLIGVYCTQYAYKRALGPLHENILDEMSKHKRLQNAVRKIEFVRSANPKGKIGYH